MADKSGMDKFANQAIITVTETATDTLTFKKLETGVSLTEKVAWIINRVEYIINNFTASLFNSSGDAIKFGLSVSNAFASASFDEQAIIDYNLVQRADFGTAASGGFMELPIIKDLSSLPSGGILVPPVPLYGFAQGVGLAAASTVACRIYYTLLPLAIDQYWELVEARRILVS